jgi:hypothetical protein
MSEEPSAELRERLARVSVPSSNGGAGTVPAPDDLDWFLYESFPECQVPLATWLELLPVYGRALRAGAAFDFELLFVRVLEHADRVGQAAIGALARAARDRLLGGGFEPPDGIIALRFLLRALPAEDGFLDDVLTRDAHAAFRFLWTLDFVLDERGATEYFALSYLRDEDPDTAVILARFPVPESRRAALESFLAPDACRRRLEDGWCRCVPDDERYAAREAVRVRIRDFEPR